MDEAEEAVERKLWWACGSMSCVWWPLAGWVALPAWVSGRLLRVCRLLLLLVLSLTTDQSERANANRPTPAHRCQARSCRFYNCGGVVSGCA